MLSLKNNWDVLSTGSDRKELSKKIRQKKGSMQNENKKENSLTRTAVEYKNW